MKLKSLQELGKAIDIAPLRHAEELDHKFKQFEEKMLKQISRFHKGRVPVLFEASKVHPSFVERARGLQKLEDLSVMMS